MSTVRQRKGMHREFHTLFVLTQTAREDRSSSPRINSVTSVGRIERHREGRVTVIVREGDDSEDGERNANKQERRWSRLGIRLKVNVNGSELRCEKKQP